MRDLQTVGGLCRQEVVTASEDMTIKDAANRMRQKHVGCLVVVRGTPARIVGILTDRDIAVVAVARDFDPQTLRVDEVMSPQVHTVAASATPAEALGTMRERGVRRLPVVDAGGGLVGIVAFDDLVDVLGQQLGALIHVLRRERAQEERVRS